MRVAADIILDLCLEQARTDTTWPHPWDHYPFKAAGKCVWVHYHDLHSSQRQQISHAISLVRTRLTRQ